MAYQAPALMGELCTALARVAENPGQSLDRDLLWRFQKQLKDANVAAVATALLPQLLALLPRHQDHPDQLVQLITELIRPLSFTTVLSYNSGPAAVMKALHSGDYYLRELALDVLGKAARSPSDTAVVAGMKEFVSDLISSYLVADVYVSSPLGSILTAYLTVDFSGGRELGVDVPMSGTDVAQPARPQGQGLMWRRFFEDKDVYKLFFSTTSLNPSHPTDERASERHRSLARSRLLALLPTPARMDFDTVQRSHFPDVELSFGLKPGEGLFDYAALHMVDSSDDVLLDMNLIDFYASSIRSLKPAEAPIPMETFKMLIARRSTPVLDYMIAKGIHDRVLGYYLYPDPERSGSADASYLSSRAAGYLATYASSYPDHALTAKTSDGTRYLMEDILSCLANRVEVSTREARENPYHNLHVLASLPRVAFLPRMSGVSPHVSQEMWTRNPLSRIPVQSGHEEFLKTLAAIFEGPTRAPPGSIFEATFRAQEPAAARAVYFYYIDRNPKFFGQLVRAAETIALTENALAAIGLMASIIEAQWGPLPSSQPGAPEHFSLPTEDQLRSFVQPGSQTPLPQTGHAAILSPPALQTVIPYLCSPPRTFTNLVGGRGDPYSAAYRVAMAKFYALRKLHVILKDDPGQPKELKALVAEAVAKGPWASGAGGGTNVATLEL